MVQQCVMETLIMNLRKIREEKKLTVTELSRRAGVSVTELSDIELGKRKPRAQTVMAIARALGVKYEEIENEHL